MADVPIQRFPVEVMCGGVSKCTDIDDTAHTTSHPSRPTKRARTHEKDASTRRTRRHVPSLPFIPSHPPCPCSKLMYSEAKIGDRVTIQHSKPFSRRKHFQLASIDGRRSETTETRFGEWSPVPLQAGRPGGVQAAIDARAESAPSTI